MNDNQRAVCPRCEGQGGGYVRTGPDDQWDSEECDWCWGAGFIPAALAERLRACDADLATAREADAQNHAQLEQIYGRVHGLEELVGGLRADLATARIEKEELAQQVNYHSGRAADARADLVTARGGEAVARRFLDGWYRMPGTGPSGSWWREPAVGREAPEREAPTDAERAWLASVSPPTSRQADG